MSFPRSARVAELIQAELAKLLLREVKDPRTGGIVVTRVELTPDLRQARVHFSRYGAARGEEGELEEGLKGLERAAHFLQAKLGERLRLKRVPELHFHIDRSVAYSDHIERLLREVRKKEETWEEEP